MTSNEIKELVNEIKSSPMLTRQEPQSPGDRAVLLAMMLQAYHVAVTSETLTLIQYELQTINNTLRTR